MSENEDVKRLIDKLMRDIIREKFKKEREIKKHSKPTLITLTDNNFEKIIRENRVVVVDFWAEWCMPCRFYEPIFKKVAEKFKGKVIFGRLNVDENPKTSMHYGITAIPTTIIFVNGKPVKQMIGLVNETALTSMVKKFVG